MMQKKVKIYTTSTCPFCHQLKRFLEENKISYENIDVTQDQKVAEEMVKKSGQMGVPVSEINGDIVIGFDREKIKKLLGIK